MRKVDVEIVCVPALVAAFSMVLAGPVAAQQRFETLYNFTGGSPVGLVAVGGVLYGASEGASPLGNNCGTVFELKPPPAPAGAWTEEILYAFAGSPDACEPLFAPVPTPNGAFYSASFVGGAYDIGAIYMLRPPLAAGDGWTESVPYSFGAPATDPGGAVSNVIAGPAGSFYILTSDGAYDYGALFQLRPPQSPGATWSGTVLYSFPPGAPPDSLIMGPRGVLYGTTLYSIPGTGLIFQLTPPAAPGGTWTETEIYSLGPGDGSSPNSLTLGPGGVLYGTAYGANEYTNGRGVVFQLTPPASAGDTWTYTVLEAFSGPHPNSPLLLHDGKLFGTLATPPGGLVFELQPPATPGGAWTLAYLHHFSNGQTPGGTLVMDNNGNLYGATAIPYGPSPSGTIYRVSTK